MLRMTTTICIATTTTWLSACAQAPDTANSDYLGEVTDDIAKREGVDPLAEFDSGSNLNGGVFDVGVIPDNGVGCPAGSEELVIKMDDEDTFNLSIRSGFVGKTNFGESSFNTRFYFCRVDGTAFRAFSKAADAANLRDDYAVLKLGTTCPSESQEFSRTYDNEDDAGNTNFSSGVINPNVSNSNTTLFFCLYRFSSLGVTQSSFPNFGNGFRYGVFAPSDFNRGALAFGSFTSDDEDDRNANSFSAPSDAVSAAQRIIEPGANAHASTIHHVVRAR